VHTLFATIAIKPDCRRHNQRLRRPLETSERLREMTCAINPAITDTRFSCLRPPATGDVLTGEMYHGIDPIDRMVGQISI
jgi:hypothetical protein